MKRAGGPKPGCWTNKMIPVVKETQYNVLKASLDSHNSSQALEKCICMYCSKVIIGPVLFKCDHASCRSCFLENNHAKPIKDTSCQKCLTNLTSEFDISSSGILQTFIDNLNVKCNQGL